MFLPPVLGAQAVYISWFNAAVLNDAYASVFHIFLRLVLGAQTVSTSWFNAAVPSDA